MDASDWIRLKRLQGSRNFEADKPNDITNPDPRSEVKTGRRVYTEFGTSRIRRTASSWIDYKAAQTADYVLESTNNTLVAKNLTINRVCRCGTASAKKVGLCPTCRS